MHDEKTLSRAIKWLLEDDTGVSSKTILSVMTGITPDNRWNSAPSDPADLGRCLRLLELFPEWKARMHLMSGVNERWAKAVECWDEISQNMKEEVGIDWSKSRSAPDTYKLMKSRGL